MSMGIAYGCLMAFASYNRFHNPLIRDALCLSMLNSVTSLIAGIIVFAALGHTALVHSLPIDQAATDGNQPLCFKKKIIISYNVFLGASQTKC